MQCGIGSRSSICCPLPNRPWVHRNSIVLAAIAEEQRQGAALKQFHGRGNWWLAGWVLAVCLGFGALFSHEFAEGMPAEPPLAWPGASRIRPARRGATLLMLAHPQCPCTQASIGELEVLMTQLHGRLSSYVLFLRPSKLPPDWRRTALFDKAGSIPGVTVAWDDDGVEAARFGASTSGQVLVYGENGNLLFSGGITGSRGHAGDNNGRSAIGTAVTTGKPATRRTFVFGCALWSIARE
jgi:hypothetical protein